MTVSDDGRINVNRSRVRALGPITALALLAMTGCSEGGEPKADQTGGGRQQGEQPASGAQGETQTPAGGQSRAPSEGGGGGKGLASREFQGATSGSAVQLRLDITGLRRQGQLATLNFSVINNSSGNFWMPADYLGDPNVQDRYDTSGVTLVDPQNARRYRVARAAGAPNGACVCSSTKGITIAQQGSTSFYATFPAPPPQLKSINVEIPLVGIINDVPIS